MYSRTGSSFLGFGLTKGPGDFDVFLRNEWIGFYSALVAKGFKVLVTKGFGFVFGLATYTTGNGLGSSATLTIGGLNETDRTDFLGGGNGVAPFIAPFLKYLYLSSLGFIAGPYLTFS